MIEYTHSKSAWRALLVSLFAFGLTACGEKVDCNSSAAKEEAIGIIQSHLDDAVWYNEMTLAITGSPKLENIKTVAADQEGKQAECIGTYSITYNEKPRPIDVTYYLAYLEDKDDVEVRVAVADVKGELMGIAMFERPIKNGEEKIYDPSGQKLVAIRNWKNGREEGLQEFYSIETGALIHQYSVVNGSKVGAEKGWMRDGTLVADLVWKDGKATGFAPTDADDNLMLRFGDQYTITRYQDGLKTGPRRTYNKSRNGEYLQRVEIFGNGMRDGLLQHFNDRGEVVFEALYHQDSMVLDDPATARSISACLDGWLAHFREMSYHRGEELSRHIEYNRPLWELQCQKSILPPNLE